MRACAELAPADCIFRINRDARFARDKSPYKTQFSAAICPQGRGTSMPAYYFHIDALGELLIGGGVYAPSPEQLANARRFILAHPERLDQLFADPVFRSAHDHHRLASRSSARPPACRTQRRHLDLLKRKQYLVGRSYVAHEFGEEAIAPLIIDRFPGDGALHLLAARSRRCAGARHTPPATGRTRCPSIFSDHFLPSERTLQWSIPPHPMLPT
jgi:uncharacterized protein (TIGR02453 family)